MSDMPQAASALSTLEPLERLRVAMMQSATAAWMGYHGAPVTAEEQARLRNEVRRGASELGPGAARRFVLEFLAAWPVTTGCCALCGGPAHPGSAYPCPQFPPAGDA